MLAAALALTSFLAPFQSPVQGPIRDGGSSPIVEPDLPDEVPAAHREPGQPGRSSDQPGRAGTGNPFFLGFAGSDYFPPDGERIDPLLEAAIARLDASRPAEEIYAFVLFSKRITPQRLEEIAALGARPIDFHPFYAWKVAVKPSAVAAIAALPFVRWIGVARPEQKLHPYLERKLALASPEEEIAVDVALFESDLCAESTSEPFGVGSVRDPGSDPREVESPARIVRSRGWQQRALEARGVKVELYIAERPALRAKATPSAIRAITQLDFVHAVEAVVPAVPADGPSASMTAADFARSVGWNGGNAALAGVIDSGVNWSHEAFASHAAWGWDVSNAPSSPWIPYDFHGALVTGGILADPPGANAHVRGYAPKLGFAPSARFRVVKWNNTPLPFPSVLALMAGNLNDGAGNITPPAHVFNNSYGGGAGAGPWKGTEGGAIDVDNAVWNNNQVVVFAAHNFGPGAGTISIEGSSKNALVVGNVPNYFKGADPGAIATDSGRGPTADGRWKPNVCAPGDGTRTCAHDSNTGYIYGGGTSMAAPHVTGLVAQLVDHYAWLRYAPARVASLLMATATTRNNVELAIPGGAEMNTYGAGRVDSYRANFTDSQLETWNWGLSLNANQGTYGDFVVGADVTRVVVCLSWIEQAPSPGASKAVVNDLDLYIDAPPSLNTTLNSGEYSAQISGVDNTEIRYIASPTPGTWRWKIFPYSAPKGSRASVTVHMVHAPTETTGLVTVAPAKSYLKPNEAVDITATCTTPSYVANGVFLDTTVNSGATLLKTSSVLHDGPTADLGLCLNSDLSQQGLDVTMGSLVHGSPRSVTYQAKWSTEGTKAWAVEARCDNWTNVGWFTGITVDGTAPSVVTNLHSTTHTPNVWSTNPNVTFAWSSATDNLSGVDGYGINWGSQPDPPVLVKDIGPVTTYSQAFPNEFANLYFTMKTVDKSGNWSSGTAVAGPYKIDAVAPSAPVNVVSATHAVGVWSSNPTITMTWSASTDATSGVAGYVTAWDHSLLSTPGGAVDTTTTFKTATLSTGTLGWFFHLRARDVAGNYGPTVDAGPFFIDTTAPSGSISLNAGAVDTISPIVSVTLNFSELASGLAQIRIKNDGGVFSAWQPYASFLPGWNLAGDGGSSKTGTRTVVCEVRDGAGNVASVSDTIFYHLPILPFGSGCGGSLGAPTLSIAGLPGIGQTLTCTVGNTAATTAYVGWGFSKTSLGGVPLPLDLGPWGGSGCPLLISYDGFVSVGAPGTTAFTIPLNPSLVDLRLYFQAILTGDPSGKPFVTTGGVILTVAGL